MSSFLILLVAAVLTAAIGWVLLSAAAGAGISADSNVTPYVLALCMLPFLLMAAAVPKRRRAPSKARVGSVGAQTWTWS